MRKQREDGHEWRGTRHGEARNTRGNARDERVSERKTQVNPQGITPNRGNDTPKTKGKATPCGLFGVENKGETA